MKTQKYGIYTGSIGSPSNLRKLLDIRMLFGPNLLGPLLMLIASFIVKWHSESLALSNYRSNRENASQADRPKWAFPQDGEFAWEEVGSDKWQLRYSEDIGDREWMHEKDKNYSLRLNQEGKLTFDEPDLQQENPVLFEEVFGIHTSQSDNLTSQNNERKNSNQINHEKNETDVQRNFRQSCTYPTMFSDHEPNQNETIIDISALPEVTETTNLKKRI